MDMTAGLAGLHDSMAAHVAAGHLPGLVTLVARGEDVHVDVIGTASFATTAPLERDAIFRIASLTKPVTAVAAMALVEAGVLRLEQPIEGLIPELAGRRVLRAIDADLDDTVAAERPITLEDLLSFRLGFGSVMAPPGSTYPIQRAEAELGLQSIGGPPWPPVAHDADSWIGALGSLPLMYQPGERWLSNTSAQVLGVVLDDPAASWWSTPPSFPDASGWLVSTIDDYWAFVSQVFAGGAGPARRVLAPATVALMTTDRLTPAQRDASALFLGEHGSWGLGLAVPAAGSADAPFPCGIGWDGGTGTTWRTNPRTGVTGIPFTQRAATSPVPSVLVSDFWAGVSAAATA